MTDSPSTPSTTAIALAVSILSLSLGYLLGTGSTLFSSSTKPPKKSWPNNYDVRIHPDSSDEELMKSLGRPPKVIKDSENSSSTSDDEDEDEQQGELNRFEGNMEECKLVLVVRTDLGMGKGKIAAQASHATLACYTTLSSPPLSPSKTSTAPTSTVNPLLARWAKQGQAKIAVQAHSEDELLTLQAKALSLGLCARIIHDAGRTQIASGTATVLGVGPGPKGVVDAVTGGLKLL